MAIELAELLRRALESDRSTIVTAEVCTVVDFDPATQTATLQPVMRRSVPSSEGTYLPEDPPEIPNCPILFLRNSDSGISLPLSRGDGVLAICTTYSADPWRRTGQISDPEDLRMHHMQSAIGIAGLAPNNNPLSWVASDALVVEHAKIMLGGLATALVVRADRLLSSALNKIAADLSTIGPHTHPVSGGTAGASPALSALTFTTAPSAEDIGCDKVYGE